MYEDKPRSAKEELKRADHLVHVSMKYSRTCAVMVNGLVRMISAIDMAIDDYLEVLESKKKIKEVPFSRKERMDLAKGLLGNPSKKMFSMYNNFKTITSSEYDADHEFRKNVCLVTKGKKKITLTQPDLIESLEKTKEFVLLIQGARDGA